MGLRVLVDDRIQPIEWASASRYAACSLRGITTIGCRLVLQEGIGYTDTVHPAALVPEFDAFLEGRGLRLEAILVGGAALALLGVISRETRDVDVLVPVLPIEIADAARTFAAESRTRGIALEAEWLNNGPASLTKDLPRGWEARKQLVYSGRSLVLHVLGRPDLLKSKLWSLCDRGRDLLDCVAMAPSPEELQEALPWITELDGAPEWPAHVEATLADLGRRLGHAL